MILCNRQFHTLLTTVAQQLSTEIRCLVMTFWKMMRSKNLRSCQNGMRYITGLRFVFLGAGEMSGMLRNTLYCCNENDRKWCVALQKPAWESLHSIVKANSHISCRKHNATALWNLCGIVPMRMETADYKECQVILKVKTILSFVFMLRLHCLFFFWLSVGNNCGKFSNF